MNLIRVTIITISCFFLSACDKYLVFEQNKDFENAKWFADSVCAYTFRIDDINQEYNVQYLVRNTLNYPFHNLFVKYEMKDSLGNVLRSELQEMQLMDSKTGQPYGNGMGDIFDNKIYAFKKYKFPRKGTYTIFCTQYMRKDPIDEIMAFGIRVEKYEEGK
ncbi:MAG: gliding motility lipoprotein GldH [Bacteroidota bacterium]|nr:gliding motility lipoprotein GldH [Bacteroidota bacterium]